jgi:hypothetical protein
VRNLALATTFACDLRAAKGNALVAEARGAHNCRHCLARFELTASTQVANGPDNLVVTRTAAGEAGARAYGNFHSINLVGSVRPPSSATATPRQRGRPRNPSTSFRRPRSSVIGPIRTNDGYSPAMAKDG